MRLRTWGLPLLLAGVLLGTGGNHWVNAQTPAPQAQPDKAKAEKNKKVVRPSARIETPKGTFIIEMYPEEAPKTVANFIALANRGFYDGLTFHRVERDFVIQGGDPNGNGSGGPGYTIPNEPNKKLSHIRGAVGMANAGINTAGSQFYVVIKKPAPALDNGQYTIFGIVTKGLDVAEKIEKGDRMTKVTVDVPEGSMPAAPPPTGPTNDAEPEFTIPVILPEGAQDFKPTVRVKVTIERNGGVVPELTRKSGSKAVDAAILDSLRAWKWKPALKEGVPIRSVQQFDYDIRTGSRVYK